MPAGEAETSVTTVNHGANWARYDFFVITGKMPAQDLIRVASGNEIASVDIDLDEVNVAERR